MNLILCLSFAALLGATSLPADAAKEVPKRRLALV